MNLTFKSLCRHLVLGAVIFSSVIQANAGRFLIPGAASHDSKTSQYVRGWWPVQGQTDNVAANACHDMTAPGTHLWILAYENGVASVKIINDGGIDKVDDDEKHVKYSLVREADLTGINERLKHLCRFNDKVYGLAIDGTTATIYRWDSEDSAPVKVYSASYDSTDDVKDMGSHPGNSSIYLLEGNGNTTIVRILAVGTDGKLSAEKTITLPYLGITDAYACIDPQEDGSFWIKTNNTYGSHYSADGAYRQAVIHGAGCAKWRRPTALRVFRSQVGTYHGLLQRYKQLGRPYRVLEYADDYVDRLYRRNGLYKRRRQR